MATPAVKWTLSTHHREAYNVWGGNPEGKKPDPDLCCESVRSSGRWPIYHQCSKKRGHGPEQAYCKQHDPAVKKARRDASYAKEAAAYEKRLLEYAAPRFFEALCKIADGDNDPRATAREAIDGYSRKK